MPSPQSTFSERVAAHLTEWYRVHQRPLPWRQTQDPYPIWISEAMLQQTTVSTVLPYFERFLTRFPTLKSLAEAEESAVLELWAGLGYYNRARQLHRAAQILDSRPSGFPRTFNDLLPLPGFGPYTARAVSSLAFSEPVGVLDGNVIRILSRLHNHPVEWWRPAGRAWLQKCADELVAFGSPPVINQALMDLGAMVCIARAPRCTTCPVRKECLSLKRKTVAQLPLPKPKRPKEKWIWHPLVIINQQKILLVRDPSLPFLKSHWVLPGRAQRVDSAPKDYSFQHAITHHQIFVKARRVSRRPKNMAGFTDQQWVGLSQLAKVAPASLIRKTVERT